MADPQTSVAINIGSQRISAAVFETAKNGALVLKAYDSESISADPAMDVTRIPQTRVAINDLVNRLKIGKSKARYAISGQSVFTRFVKLPPLQDDNVEQLVTYEAQQHVPFPLPEVVWDYELIDTGSEKECVIVAIKADALNEVNSAVNDSGLSTAEVDVSPMALYNAFRASYGQLDEPVLLIDIGARTSNLLYIEGTRFFTRSVTVGGSSISAAIAKEYNIGFLEAEHQKISNGLVALGGGHTEQLEEGVAALAMSIRNALSRLPSEITRTTNYYRSQHGGNAPKRVLLAGGGANLPYTLEFLQEKLNMPVEFFNPMRHVALGKGIDADLIGRESHLMGELVGLGMRGIGQSGINIDLVPVTVEAERVASRRKPFFIAAAATLLGGAAVWAALQTVAASAARDKAEEMAEARESIAPVKGRIDGLLRKESSLKAIGDSYVRIETQHSYWIDLLAELRGAFASDAVWLTDLEPVVGYQPGLPKQKGNAKQENGKSVVKPEFYNTQYGLSSMTEIKQAAPPPPPRGRQAQEMAPAVPMANAVRITGFWRENPDSQNAVSKLLANLRKDPVHFRFNVKNPEGKEIELRDEQILDITITGKAGEFGLPFTITLPLAGQVPVY